MDIICIIFNMDLDCYPVQKKQIHTSQFSVIRKRRNEGFINMLLHFLDISVKDCVVNPPVECEGWGRVKC